MAKCLLQSKIIQGVTQCFLWCQALTNNLLCFGSLLLCIPYHHTFHQRFLCLSNVMMSP